MMKIVVFCVLVLMFLGCGEEPLSCEAQRQALELDIHNDLDTIHTDSDFTLAIQSDDGRRFTHSIGSSTLSTQYKSASTSKMVSVAIILDVVSRTTLTLESHPQDFIPRWNDTSNHSNITLKELLSFTSGLSADASCLNSGSYDFDSCVERIRINNSGSTLPGLQFNYGPNHLQVAGLMAVKASASGSWNGLFNSFKTKTNLFFNSTYDLPSQTNPRLAGGMHWSANEYLSFLEALYKKEILTPELVAQMTQDQRVNATSENSPSLDGLGEDWHYGFGVWIESESNPFDATKLTGRISSPGLYGAYPFIDYKHHYYGILAREGGFNTFTKGYELFREVSPKLESWAASTCQ